MLATVHRLLAVLALSAAACEAAQAAGPLAPREIPLDRRNVAAELVAATRDDQIERGRKRPVLDGLGWVCGIPGRILLWDRRVDNHAVSPRTEDAIRAYLAANDLDHVKVRINQYAPLDDWKRLHLNKTVGWGYRYTFGALSVAGEALFPGRLFGGDRYNPWTATVHLYSDVPAIALHEGGHAKDFTRRDWPGSYAFVTDLGGNVADVLAAPIALPVHAGTLVAGHVVGRVKAGAVAAAPEPPAEVASEPEDDDATVADAMAQRRAW